MERTRNTMYVGFSHRRYWLEIARKWILQNWGHPITDCVLSFRVSIDRLRVGEMFNRYTRVLHDKGLEGKTNCILCLHAFQKPHAIPKKTKFIPRFRSPRSRIAEADFREIAGPAVVQEGLADWMNCLMKPPLSPFARNVGVHLFTPTGARENCRL